MIGIGLLMRWCLFRVSTQQNSSILTFLLLPFGVHVAFSILPMLGYTGTIGTNAVEIVNWHFKMDEEQM